jgi:hypothetical protein
MTIPRRAQVFDAPVELSDKDRERLCPHLSNWRALHSVMLLGLNEPDLRRLVVLELLGQQRRMILRRLTARLSSVQFQTLQERIEKYLGKR